MSHEVQGSPPLYNVRIIKTYMEYLEKYYPDISVDEALDYIGMTRYQIEDTGLWYTQEIADRFHEFLNKKTGNNKISRDAGRFVVSSRAYKIMREYVHGFIGPEKAYNLLPKIHTKVSRGVSLEVQKQDRSRLEVIATPFPEVREKPYQCENRIGQFEAIACGFTGLYAQVDHPECIHRGDSHCRYIISWKEPLFLRIRRYRNILLLFSLLVCLAGEILLPWSVLMKPLVFCVLLVSGITVLSWFLENKENKKQIEEQSFSAEMLIAESNARFNDATLARELGQAISSSLDIDKLLDTVMHILKNRLDFERGSLFLANEQMTRLIYKAGYGLTPAQEVYLKSVQLHLDNPESKGPIVVSFKERKPFFIDNSDSIFSDLSDRSQELLHLTESTSFICVPIVFKDEPLGVLAVDREKSTVPLKQKDLDLLMVIAPQIAISINNVRMFEKMQASEEKYRDLVESANSIIMRLDLQGRITFVNKYAREFYGYEHKGIVGKKALGLIVPNVDSNGRDFSVIFSDFLDHPERHDNFENENIRSNGDRVWVSWSNKAIYDKNSHVSEILCVGNDITDRKKNEKEKKSLEIQLLRSQKMEAIGTLAGGVAHDLNNILSGIVSYPEILLMELPPDSPMRKSLEVIKRSGEKAATIVQDLLTLARRGVNVSNVVNLNTIINEYFKSPEYGKLKQYHSNISLGFQLSNDLGNILGSNVHLSKTLMNLVSNAAEAMPDGGIITVSTRNQRVDKPIRGFDIIAEGEYAVLSVADAGIGISSEDVKRIFEPFYSKKVMGRSGTGLGMAVIWSTIKDHQGYIDIQTKLGHGTRFDLYFPVTRMEMKTQDTNESIQTFRGNEKILVVDDVSDQREIAKQFLEKLGYEVNVAGSGEEALEYMKEHKADLMLLDMIMDPGMDGLDTYKKILEINKNQKAIIISGFSESDRVKTAISLGAGIYMRKPYVLHEMAKAVRTELDR